MDVFSRLDASGGDIFEKMMMEGGVLQAAAGLVRRDFGEVLLVLNVGRIGPAIHQPPHFREISIAGVRAWCSIWPL